MKQENMMFELDRLMRVIKRGRPIRRGSTRLLRLIQQQPMITSTQCAEALDIRVSSINERVLRLVEKGLVKREALESDRRRNGLMITKLGEDALLSLQQERDRFNDKINEILTGDERSQLSILLRKLSDGLECR